MTPTDTPPADSRCGSPGPAAPNCDTAVFANPLAEYLDRPEPERHLDGDRQRAAAREPESRYGDRHLRNIERLQFADTTIAVPKPLNTVPGVVGLTQAAATSAILAAGLTVGQVTSAPSTTIHIGLVAASNPLAGRTLPAGSPVALVTLDRHHGSGPRRAAVG